MSTDFEQLRSLAESLLLYVGAELSRSAGLPTHRDLLGTLLREAEDYLSARQLRELNELVEAGALGDAFGELERALTPASFGRIVERELDDASRELPPLARAIAALGSRVRGVITPNLDGLLERAFEGTLAVHAQPVADLASRRQWLFKIHGTLHDRSTWVFTEEQRGRVLYRDPLHGQLFRGLFLAHPILFVGTRLDDPVLIDVVQQITALAGGQPPKHWALVDEAEAGPVRRRKLAGAGINLIGYPNQDQRHDGCIRLLEQLAGRSPSPSPVVAPRQQPLAVLFVAANPTGTDPLRVDRELRIIREAIDRSRHREHFQFDIRMAATIHDLRRALLERRYDIVHMSGHGGPDGLILEDERGESVHVPKHALAALFAHHAPPAGGLRCVVLNACFSLSTGEVTSMNVPFTIAMAGPISDVGAAEFSRGFYDAIGAGKDFAAAYREGRLCVDLAAADAQFESQLLEV
jgi:hypothetical protein